MKTDKPFIEAMRHATHLVRTQGAGAATRYIQELLRSRTATSNPAQADTRAEASHASAVEVLDATPATEPSVHKREAYAPDAFTDIEADLFDAAPKHAALVEESAVLPTDAGQFLAKRFSNQSGARNYKLYVPASYAGAPSPLIVMLHGCTQDPDDFAVGTRANRWAETLRCLVAYPEQQRRSNSRRCWNWFRPGDQQPGRGEPAIIAGIAQQVIDEYRIDARRVYVAGLSAGGAMAAIMGQAYPELFAAIGIHSGVPTRAATSVPSAFAVMKNGHSRPHTGLTPVDTEKRAVPTIVLHGDADQTVHPANAEHIVADAVKAYSVAQPQQSLRTVVEIAEATSSDHAYRRTTHADHLGTVLIERWEIHGAGHTWSGGNATGSHTDARGPDATKAMIEFFKQHAVREPATAAKATDSADPTRS